MLAPELGFELSHRIAEPNAPARRFREDDERSVPLDDARDAGAKAFSDVLGDPLAPHAVFSRLICDAPEHGTSARKQAFYRIRLLDRIRTRTDSCYCASRTETIVLVPPKLIGHIRVGPELLPRYFAAVFYSGARSR